MPHIFREFATTARSSLSKRRKQSKEIPYIDKFHSKLKHSNRISHMITSSDISDVNT